MSNCRKMIWGDFKIFSSFYNFHSKSDIAEIYVLPVTDQIQPFSVGKINNGPIFLGR